MCLEHIYQLGLGATSLPNEDGDAQHQHCQAIEYGFCAASVERKNRKNERDHLNDS